MSTPTVKQETVEYIKYDGKPPCSNNMYPSEHLQSTEYVNYYDSKDFELKQLKEEFPEDECLQSDFTMISKKEEFPEDECLQSDFSMISKIVFENNSLLKLVDDQEVKHENTGEGLLLKIENGNEKDQVTIKSERLDEQDIFKNGFNLLKHNQEHIKVKIITPGDNEMDEIHQCRCCDTHLDNDDNMLKNFSLVHKQKTVKCRKQLKSASNLKPHIQILHKNNKSPKQVRRKSMKCKYCNVYFENRYVLYKHMELCRTGKMDEGIQYKCDSCKRFFSSKATLTLHKKMTHTDYGRMFGCLCGKQFRSPLQLDKHKKRHLDRENQNTNKDKFQCDICEKFFKCKRSLVIHIRRCHTDYNKIFECWCGKEFLTPIHIDNHKTAMHYQKIQNTNKDKFQCDICQKLFKYKGTLVIHIKRCHNDYDKVFDCWCRKQYPTLIHLSQHKMRKHNSEIQNSNKDKFQCVICQKIFIYKNSLVVHIKRCHTDYDKVFDCWCGKQFPTPVHLDEHMRWHYLEIQNSNKNKFQCDMCQKFFIYKSSLVGHIYRYHTDYDKVFDCWCGKQFPTPLHLDAHKRRKHNPEIKNSIKNEFQCDMCQKFFIYKSSLVVHIKKCHIDDNWCGKQFATHVHLDEHNPEIQHSNKNKFQCDMCQKNFIDNNQLFVHKKGYHTNYDKVFECWCGEQFRTLLQLDMHKKAKHVFEHDGFKFIFSS